MHKLSMNSEFIEYNGLISRNLLFLTKIAVPHPTIPGHYSQKNSSL